MKYIEMFGTNFIGLFQAGADVFMSFMTGIIPLLIVLLTFTNAVIALIGADKVEKWVVKRSNNIFFRYTLMPMLAVLMLTNPMCYTMGRFLKEEYKPAFYDATVSFVHPVTGLFPYANAGELFVFLGIADGVTKAGYNQGSLAVRYFIAGIIVIFIRGFVTEKITKILTSKKQTSATRGE